MEACGMGRNMKRREIGRAVGGAGEGREMEVRGEGNGSGVGW